MAERPARSDVNMRAVEPVDRIAMAIRWPDVMSRKQDIVNTKNIPQPLRAHVKRAYRKYARLDARAAFAGASRSRNRAFRAQLTYARTYNRAARITGAEMISGITLRPHSEAR